ncbi:hypothetical protein CGZ93_06620 [Enemella dayhoffiae]|uniref:Cytochrome bc1 complex Rieske iron-sulfur subunit n=1 Tax=Enemella dayhoffiae TaxID=2016507 RepID=A0A255H5Z6_9ACTN|nr:Rieske (2Fe-2S) protein [Enemella dayhoffiae]OYO23128.1 hypothetical protein CGZ93_06620 [Enemella dayhoffiae]
MTTSRRGVLTATLGLSALAVGGLTACSSGAGSQNTRTTAPAGGAATPASQAPTGGGTSATPTGGGTTPSSPVAGALAKTADVPVGGGKILTAERMVLTQPSAGQFVGLSGICPHQGCMVSSLRGASIVCGCHGSQFGLDGAVQRGPSNKPLEKVNVKVDGDSIVKA